MPAPVRALAVAISVPGELGRLPTVHLDASLGLPCAGYRSAEVAFGSCGAEGRAMVRLVGTIARSRSSSRRELPRRAKVGRSATHVALPLSSPVRDNGDLKAKGGALWQEFGPRAPRRLAFLHFAETSRSLL